MQTMKQGIEPVREICQSLGALGFSATTSAAERKRLWQARNHAYEILVRAYPATNVHQRCGRADQQLSGADRAHSGRAARRDAWRSCSATLATAIST